MYSCYSTRKIASGAAYGYGRGIGGSGSTPGPSPTFFAWLRTRAPRPYATSIASSYCGCRSIASASIVPCSGV